jgi:translation initiation factor IF-1
MSQAVELRAYENDVLHALSETGGLPGVDAKNEVTILRGAFSSARDRDRYMEAVNDVVVKDELLSGPNAIKIPLRIGPYDEPLEIHQQDIILNNGDIVFVESRETEVFYTGGLLPAGQFPLPRDYDIDVIEAMAMAGGSVASAAGANQDTFRGSGDAALGAIFPPTRVMVLRKINGDTVPIAVDLKRALLDTMERVRIVPGDFITLEYTPAALMGNIVARTLRVNYLVNGISR